MNAVFVKTTANLVKREPWGLSFAEVLVPEIDALSQLITATYGVIKCCFKREWRYSRRGAVIRPTQNIVLLKLL